LVYLILERGGKVKAYDPEAMDEMRKLFPQVTYVSTSYDALKDVDAMIILTEWNEFRNMDLDFIKSVMKKPIIVDARNIYDPAAVLKKGFLYECVGRSIERIKEKLNVG